MAHPVPADLTGLGPEEMRELHRALFASGYDAQYVLDAEMDEFLLVNDAFLRMTGFTREQLIGSGFKAMSLIDPRQRAEVEGKRKQLGAVPAESYEVRVLTSRGALVLELNVRRITLKGRALVLGSGRDVTARRRSEEALRESEERMRLLLGQMPAIVWTTDTELRWTSSMGAGLKVLSQTPNQYAGISMYDYFRTKDPGFPPIAMHLRALAGEPVTYDFTWEGTTWHAFVQPLRDPLGAVTGCVGVAIDITNRSDAERKLRESEERFHRFSDATTEGISVSEGGRILYSNSNLALMFGYEPSEMLGKEILALCAPESRDLVAKNIQSGHDRPYEGTGLRKDGSTFPFEASGKPFVSQGRTFRMSAVRDLTRVKQLSATLEREVRMEKKKTLEAFQANVRIFQLTEKIRAAYESTTKLVNSRNVEELLASAVALLCDPAGLDYREATVYVARGGNLESIAAFPEHRTESIPCDSDHPLAQAFREQPLRPPDSGGLALPLKGQAGPLGLLEVRFHSTEEVRSWQENILRTLANSLSLMVDNLNLYEVVRRQSITDVLTGAHNRRYFDEKLRAEVERAARYKRSMALVMIDLDDLKRINDTTGHPQGDAVLAELGAILRKQSRQIDSLSRYGGDEFALILPETGLENAILHAERIREMVASRPFPNRREPDKPFRVTLSLGVADVAGDRRTAESVLDAADRACFLAKRGGKNQVKSVRDLGEGGDA